MRKPSELSGLFNAKDFEKYPFIRIPQKFSDSRGLILNIADGKLGDVAFISSARGSIRANHTHKEDWHLTYLINGSMIYQWLECSKDSDFRSIKVESGDLIFTPEEVAHKMTFLEESSFIAISRLNRDHDSYESDTVRLEEKFFPDARL